MKITANPSIADAKFLYYLFRTPEQKQYIFNSAIQTGVPHTNLGILKATPVDLPPLPTQKEIAAIFGALDDRIDVLRETNATLEAIAQALFKSWFVDFDPVRAKEQGLAPAGMDEATAALFPASPEDWQIQASRPVVYELIATGALLIGDGYRAKNFELGQPGLPFVRAGDLDTGQITPTKDYLAERAVKMASTKRANAGDTAFTSKGTIGRFAFVDDASGDAVYSPQVCFWRSLRSDVIEPAYLHYWMKSAAFKAQVDMVRGQAAIMDYVSLADQRRMRLDLPPLGVQKCFADTARVLLDRISCNRATANQLATLRDTLLPRLISGRLRLPQAEAELAEAVA
jgi:type I restriction enzyme S subunit